MRVAALCLSALLASEMAIGWWSSAVGEVDQTDSRKPAARSPDQPHPFLIGEFQSEIPRLSEPMAVTIDEDGLLYIAQGGAANVLIVDRAGQAIATRGQYGEDLAEFLWPGGITVSQGDVFVTDAGLHRVRVFDREGKVRSFWGRHGAEPGQFNRPAGIAASPAGDFIVIADAGNDRVQVFDRFGDLLHVIGSRGSREGLFMRPLAVAVDAQQNIFVADADNNRIQKFGSDGRFLKAFGEWGPFPGMFDEPSGLALVGDSLFVVDRRNHRVQVFTVNGEFIEEWGVHEMVPHEGKGRLHYPDGLAIAPQGDFAVIVEAIEDRVQIFAPRAPGEAPPPRPFFDKAGVTHFGHHLSIDGNLMVIAEPENHFVFVFDILPPTQDGNVGEVPIIISQFGERGERFGLLMRAAGINLDFAARTIWLSDSATNRLQRYRFDYEPPPAGQLRFNPEMVQFAEGWEIETAVGEPAAPDSTTRIWPIEPAGLKRDAAGRLYIIDSRNDAIHVIGASVDGRAEDEEDPPANGREPRPSFSFGGAGAQPGRFNRPTDLAFSRDGETIFVVDSLNRRVQAFGLNGAHKFSFGKHGPGDGQFMIPAGISAGRDGFVYVTDAGTGRIQKFDETGKWVSQFGRRPPPLAPRQADRPLDSRDLPAVAGARMGELWKPQGIAQAEDGRVFVIDYGNHRGQIFAADGEWLVTFGAGRAYTRTRRPPEE